LFAPGVMLASGRVADHQAPPAGAEEALAARMTPARRAQFTAGRMLARKALARLGVAATALPRAASGAPVWPAGCVGSITHCGEGAAGWCIVAVAHGDARLSLGLDAEVDRPLDPALVERVLRPEETRRRTGDDDLLTTVIFSAKESVYKALNPLTGRFLDFHDVAIALDVAGGEFAARVLQPDWPTTAPRRLSGRWRRQGGLVLTAVEVPHRRG
jgi:4'-phosphopantetheinyl transferase EntD